MDVLNLDRVKTEDFYDQLAMCDEKMMEAYLERGHVETTHIKKAVKERKVFPCFFGSALKLEGVEAIYTGYCKVFHYTLLP